MYHQFREGWIEVIAGCMFSGKTEELIKRVRVLGYAKKNVMVFKAKIDDRYSKDRVASHNGLTVPSIPISFAKEIYDHVTTDIDVIAIDEAQFLDEEIIEVATYFADLGKRVIVVGLDTDFKGIAFGPMPELMARAEYVDKLSAICAVCSAPATRSQRLINGVPAAFNSDVILVGSTESYEPRCRHCHEVKKGE